MGELPVLLFLFLYIFLAYRFTRNSAKALMEYRKREQRRYEIIPGTIVDFAQRRVSRPRGSGKMIVFYPVFEYQWNGKTHRGYARRVMAKFGPGLAAVPATKMQIGDPVQVRVFPKKPSDARIEEDHYFWKSRIWVHILTVLLGSAMIICGLYWAVSRLFFQ